MSGLVWPSEQKLQRLRQQGEVPMSLLALRAMLSLGFILWVVLGGDHVIKLWEYAFTADSPELFWNDAEREVLHVLLFPLVLASLGCLLLGLLQSRFLFSFGLLSIQMKRLWKGRIVPSEGDLARGVLFLFGPLCCVLLAASSLYLLLYPLLSLLRLEHTQIPTAMWEGVLKLLPLMLGIHIVALIASILLGRLLFRWCHRMSMEEVRKEAEDE